MQPKTPSSPSDLIDTVQSEPNASVLDDDFEPLTADQHLAIAKEALAERGEVLSTLFTDL